VLRVVARFEGFEGHKVRNAEKKNKMVRVEEKNKNNSIGERSLVGPSLFQAFAMERNCVHYRS